MVKVMIIILAMMGLMCSSGTADEVILKSGKTIEGNILSVDEKQGVRIDVVLDGRLTGIQMQIGIKEIEDFKMDDKYRDLQREGPTEEQKAAHEAFLQRQRYASVDVDRKIRERVEREAYRVREMEQRQEDKRRFERILAQEKEMEVLETEMQKELIDFSQKKGISPEVTIFKGKF